MKNVLQSAKVILLENVTHIFRCPVQACYRNLGSEHC